jgi:O-antigen/teichoic acid export membrane protein
MPELNKLRSLFWARKFSGTILDQGLISGSNFVINLALARVLGPQAYGAYAVVFSIFLLFGTVHQSVLLEPMSVLEPAHFSTRRREYLGALIRAHLVISLLFVSLIGLACVYLYETGDWRLASTLAGLILAIPCILFFWMARAAMYLECEPGLAVRGSALYCVVLASSMYAVYSASLLTPFMGFVLMSFASAVAGLYLMFGLRPVLGDPASALLDELRSRHWNYSRWGLGITIIQWAQVNSGSLMVGYLLGLEKTGALTMMYAFALPVQHILSASSRLITPRLANMSARKGRSSIVRPVRTLAILFLAGVGLYWALLALASQNVVHAVYGPAYVKYAPYLPWALLYVVLSAPTFPQELGLRSMLSPQSIFRVQVTTAVLTVIIYAIAIPSLGMPGVFTATAAANLLGLILTTRLFHQQAHEERPAAVPVAV